MKTNNESNSGNETIKCHMNTEGADVLEVVIDRLKDKPSIHPCRDTSGAKVEMCEISIKSCTGHELTLVSIASKEMMKVIILLSFISIFYFL